MALHDRDSGENGRPDQEQFWQLYLQEHQRPLNCWLHVIGIVLSWLMLVAAVALRWWSLLILVPVVGYGMAWLGHLLVEGNRPTSVRFPLRSLLADYKLTWLMLTGRHRLSTTAVRSLDPTLDRTTSRAEWDKS